MNERIRELAEQAWDATAVSPEFGHPVSFAEKFAELIVRECIAQLELVRKYRYDRIQPLETQQTIIDECQYQIKEHFGVE